MSILAKLKNMPTAYWVVGLGGAALGIDYFVEGDRSVVSSLYRGVFGGGRPEPMPAGRLSGSRPGLVAPGRQMLVPGAMGPRVYYSAVAPFYPHRHHHPSYFGFRGPHPHWDGFRGPGHHGRYGWER